jgi:2-dehydropantoate 2-reductase
MILRGESQHWRMQIVVLGAGAIGSALGARLSRVESVTLIGHDTPHLRTLRENPLTVIGPGDSRSERAVPVTTNHQKVAEADLIILAVKSYDTATALADIEPDVGNTDILTVQNGLGNIEQIRDSVGPEQVLGGTTTMGAFVPEPGQVRIDSLGHTRIGRPWGSNGAFLEIVKSAFQTAGMETTVEREIRQAIWEKVLINVGINPVTALGRVTNGQLQSGPGQQLLQSIITEASAVADAEGYDIENPVERATAVVEATADNRSSMVRDVESGTKTEIGALNGAIIERADTHDIPVPVNRTITAAVRLASGSRNDQDGANPSNGQRK